MIVNGKRRYTAALPFRNNCLARAGWHGASGCLLVSKTNTFKRKASEALAPRVKVSFQALNRQAEGVRREASNRTAADSSNAHLAKVIERFNVSNTGFDPVHLFNC